jgi:hypothetical protein
MILFNAALVAAYWERLLVLPLEQRRVAGREPPSEQRSEGNRDSWRSRYYDPGSAYGPPEYGYPGDRSSEDWSAGIGYPIEPASFQGSGFDRR